MLAQLLDLDARAGRGHIDTQAFSDNHFFGFRGYFQNGHFQQKLNYKRSLYYTFSISTY